MAWLALFLYLAGAATAFQHIYSAMDAKLTVLSVLLGVVFWPFFWPVMYGVVLIDTAIRRKP